MAVPADADQNSVSGLPTPEAPSTGNGKVGGDSGVSTVKLWRL